MNILNWELQAGQIVLYSVQKINIIKLTALEYKALRRLKDKRIHSKEDLILYMYDYKEPSTSDENNLKAIIWRLNKKIKPIGHIDSRYGWGYIFSASIGERKDGEKQKN